MVEKLRAGCHTLATSQGCPRAICRNQSGGVGAMLHNVPRFVSVDYQEIHVDRARRGDMSHLASRPKEDETMLSCLSCLSCLC